MHDSLPVGHEAGGGRRTTVIIPGGKQTIKEFGFGLAFAVLVDAFVIRSVLVPATMHLIGPANWALPAWLDRVLPNLSIEAKDQPPVPAEMDPLLVG